MLHDAGDEVAGAGEGVEDVDTGVGEGLAELLLEDFLDGADHEVDDGLRGVDDAVGVGLFGVEALEELLVDGVEEVLLFGVAGLGLGGLFDGGVEAVERLEELVAGEVAGGDGADDFFDLGGEDVALQEFLVLKTLRKMRSVRRCWTSIFRIASSERSGLMDWRQSSAEERKFSRKVAFRSYSLARMSVTPLARSGIFSANLVTADSQSTSCAWRCSKKSARISRSFSGSVMGVSRAMRLS